MFHFYYVSLLGAVVGAVEFRCCATRALASGILKLMYPLQKGSSGGRLAQEGTEECSSL